MTPGYVAHEAKLEEHFDSSYKQGLDTIQGQKKLEDTKTKKWTENQKKWAGNAKEPAADPAEKQDGMKFEKGALAEKEDVEVED